MPPTRYCTRSTSVYKMNLFDASAQLAEFASGYRPADAEGNLVPVSEDRAARENERAMAELREMMKSTGIPI